MTSVEQAIEIARIHALTRYKVEAMTIPEMLNCFISSLHQQGLVIVPREPSAEMLEACRRAHKLHIEGMSQQERSQLRMGKRGLGLNWRTKAQVRYRAMIEAAAKGEQ